MDGGAWWAAVHGVAQSQTRLKRLSSSSSKFPDAAAGGGQEMALYFNVLATPPGM